MLLNKDALKGKVGRTVRGALQGGRLSGGTGRCSGAAGAAARDVARRTARMARVGTEVVGDA